MWTFLTCSQCVCLAFPWLWRPSHFRGPDGESLPSWSEVLESWYGAFFPGTWGGSRPNGDLMLKFLKFMNFHPQWKKLSYFRGCPHDNGEFLRKRRSLFAFWPCVHRTTASYDITAPTSSDHLSSSVRLLAELHPPKPSPHHQWQWIDNLFLIVRRIHGCQPTCSRRTLMTWRLESSSASTW